MSPLCSEERRALLDRARQAITHVVRYQSIEGLPAFPALSGKLAEPGSAFVTVHCAKRLRGCVGRTDRTLTLAEVVAQCAIGAALHDRRFRPIDESELPAMTIEVSVLSELQPATPDALEVGTHGVMICRGERRGLLLPQVAAERGWSVEQFLQEVCRKAELPPAAWKDPETKIFAFTAEVFSESDFGVEFYSTST
jgi:AmmeMemoRadiSam system protein A